MLPENRYNIDRSTDVEGYDAEPADQLKFDSNGPFNTLPSYSSSQFRSRDTGSLYTPRGRSF